MICELFAESKYLQFIHNKSNMDKIIKQLV